MKVVPEDVSTAPLEGASVRGPQSTAVGRCLITITSNPPLLTHVDKLVPLLTTDQKLDIV